jgi:acyl-coenzyme A synthetase/AMP-(fatty) acid ligase
VRPIPYPAQTTAEEAANSHGLPLPGNVIKTVDPLTGAVVPLRERGEIAVKRPTPALVSTCPQALGGSFRWGRVTWSVCSGGRSMTGA